MRLNCTLDSPTLVPKLKKPFDVLVKGFFLKIVGTTRRQLNFLWLESDPGYSWFGGFSARHRLEYP
jgi:hypothetical protein